METPTIRCLATCLFSGLAVAFFLVLHPWGNHIGGFPLVAWTCVQSIGLMLVGLAVGWFFARSRRMTLVVSVWVAIVMLVVIGDVIAFHWIGHRLISSATWRVITLRESLAGYVTTTMVASAAALLVGYTIVLVCVFWSSAALANWFQRRPRKVTELQLLGGMAVLGLLLAMPAMLTFSKTHQAMQLASTRHPLCALRIVGHKGVGVEVPPAIRTSEKRSPLADAIASGDRRQRLVSVDQESIDEMLPDVLVVVIESFRHELVDPEVMPNLAAVAERGIHCRRHFSGGNATNHGVFSIVNGLDAIWYERPVRFSPLMNRLLKQAGYELGFFAGHNDWRKFLMDGYISESHYGEFYVTRPNGLESDRDAVIHASRFLSRDEPKRAPRFALLYLYATHATYRSYVEDQVFSPAADDRFLYPYTADQRDRVWNRYRNAAHTVDRFLESVLADDRVVMVTGDHGEAFLEDGTCGHGSRLSKVQNMTPAVLQIPGGTPRVIRHPTSHADLLPTLLAALGLQTTDSDVFDGVDLTRRDDASLSSRVLVTRNYLQEDVALIGPWSRDDPSEESLFAVRAALSLDEPRFRILNAIDAAGNELDVSQAKIDPANRWHHQFLRNQTP